MTFKHPLCLLLFTIATLTLSGSTPTGAFADLHIQEILLRKVQVGPWEAQNGSVSTSCSRVKTHQGRVVRESKRIRRILCCWNLVYARASLWRHPKCRHVGPEAGHVGPEVHLTLVRPDQKMTFYRGRIATIA